MNRQLVLERRPGDGLVADSDFKMIEAPMPEPGAGEALAKIVLIGFDPTQRGWLNDAPGYMPPVQIGEVMRASGVAEVIESNTPEYAPGDLVQGMFGWQEYAVVSGTMPFGGKVPEGVTPEQVLGVYGVTGITAYFGVLDLGEPKPGDTVVVSGAAGATGSVAGQIARIKGCKVIGIAGGPDKCKWVVDEARFDACIDYKSDDVGARLSELCPSGINIYFDNVGGPILDACLARLAMNARVVLCGGISSGYGDGDLPAGPKNIMSLVITRSKMEGFLVLDYLPRFSEAVDVLRAWAEAGEIAAAVDIQEGLENAPATLRRLFEGKNLGKQLLKLNH